jgi:hypothetical protein
MGIMGTNNLCHAGNMFLCFWLLLYTNIIEICNHGLVDIHKHRYETICQCYYTLTLLLINIKLIKIWQIQHWHIIYLWFTTIVVHITPMSIDPGGIATPSNTLFGKFLDSHPWCHGQNMGLLRSVFRSVSMSVYLSIYIYISMSIYGFYGFIFDISMYTLKAKASTPQRSSLLPR